MSDRKEQQLATTEATRPHKVERTRSRALFSPAVDIIETSEKVLLRADLPGVQEKDIDVTLENGVLTLKARAEESVPEQMRLVTGEYVPGDFERVFSLSEDIDQENIRASVRNGVLTLDLPKAAPAKPRKITISSD